MTTPIDTPIVSFDDVNTSGGSSNNVTWLTRLSIGDADTTLRLSRHHLIRSCDHERGHHLIDGFLFNKS